MCLSEESAVQHFLLPPSMTSVWPRQRVCSGWHLRIRYLDQTLQSGRLYLAVCASLREVLQYTYASNVGSKVDLRRCQCWIEGENILPCTMRSLREDEDPVLP